MTRLLWLIFQGYMRLFWCDAAYLADQTLLLISQTLSFAQVSSLTWPCTASAFGGNSGPSGSWTLTTCTLTARARSPALLCRHCSTWACFHTVTDSPRSPAACRAPAPRTRWTATAPDTRSTTPTWTASTQRRSKSSANHFVRHDATSWANPSSITPVSLRVEFTFLRKTRLLKILPAQGKRKKGCNIITDSQLES